MASGKRNGPGRGSTRAVRSRARPTSRRVQELVDSRRGEAATYTRGRDPVLGSNMSHTQPTAKDQDPIERAARIAYETMVERCCNAPLGAFEDWAEQSELLREDWRAAIRAAIRSLGK